LTRARSRAERIGFADRKLRQANVDEGVAWNIRVVANPTDPFDSPKKIVGWKIVDCVNGFSHSKIITDSGSSFANSVRPFAFNFRLPNCIRT
jgi:hypothetical protein